MKCPGCKKQKKADNCIQCKNKIETRLNAALDEIEFIANGSTSMNAIINKINQIRRKAKG